MENQNNLLTNIKNSVANTTSYSSDKYLSGAKEFLASNTMIAKATFIILMLLLFCFIYIIGSKIIVYLLSPSETPYLFTGMRDGNEQLIIPQSMANESAIPLLRSRNQYDGIEFTYTFWIYVNNVNYKEDVQYKHIFSKGSTIVQNAGILGPNNSPGVYLYTGKQNYSRNLIDTFPLLGMLVRLNVYHDSENSNEPYKYYDDINVDGIPIKKWVGVVIRLTNQNIVDVYINGQLTKRQKLNNIVKQNYDNVNVSMNGGFDGKLSNLRYYNYAIGTFEIDKITSAGPNLTTDKESNLEKSKPYYLSKLWYFNDTSILT